MTCRFILNILLIAESQSIIEAIAEAFQDQAQKELDEKLVKLVMNPQKFAPRRNA